MFVSFFCGGMPPGGRPFHWEVVAVSRTARRCFALKDFGVVEKSQGPALKLQALYSSRLEDVAVDGSQPTKQLIT